MFKRVLQFLGINQRSSPVQCTEESENSYLFEYLQNLPDTRFLSFFEMKKNLESQGFMVRSVSDLAFAIIDLVKSEEFETIRIQKEFLLGQQEESKVQW